MMEHDTFIKDLCICNIKHNGEVPRKVRILDFFRLTYSLIWNVFENIEESFQIFICSIDKEEHTNHTHKTKQKLTTQQNPIFWVL